VQQKQSIKIPGQHKDTGVVFSEVANQSGKLNRSIDAASKTTIQISQSNIYKDEQLLK